MSALSDQSEPALERVADVLRDELAPWIAHHPNAGWFDYRVLAQSVLNAAFDEERRPHA
jgi:hypothetical protein